MTPAIRAQNVSKMYRLGAPPRARAGNLRDALGGVLGAPLRWLRGARPAGGPGGAGESADTLWALRDVSFEVPHGQVLGIVGRNGSGKSTLLKILSQIVEPTGGRIERQGRLSSLLEVGTGFHPELTGRENTFLNGSILGMSAKEIGRKFDAIVAFAGIEKFIDTPVKRYSSGMYVRLAFSVAAHLQPDILILDEVLAVGDAVFQEKCMTMMEQTARSGKTILFVSHNMVSVQHLCDRVLYLKDGRVQAVGPSREVVRQYFADCASNLPVSWGSSVPLEDWPDRYTQGPVRVVRLDIADGDGRPATAVPVGGAVRFTITADFPETVHNPVFGVIAHNTGHEPFIDLRSIHAGLKLGPVRGRVSVTCTLDSVGLHPGEYFLSPWASNSNMTEVDWLRYCCGLRVDPSPGPHGELMLDPEYGRYWVMSDWGRAG